MRRFFAPPAQCSSQDFSLIGPEAHHATHVLRVRAGERITVLNGVGDEFLCEVRDSTRDAVHLAVLEQKHHPPPPCRVTLLQALPKGKLFETIVQKATELGASRIIPLLSERVVVQLDQMEAARKAEKWQAVAIEAIKQCGSSYLPEVAPPVSPEDFLSRKEPFELCLVACLQPGSKHPREHFDGFRSRHGRNPASACVWIGPEGDFTPAEYKAIKAADALPISLGPLILRSDTAMGYCLSLLNYELNASAPTPETNGPGAQDS